jgi:hypothetical protein
VQERVPQRRLPVALFEGRTGAAVLCKARHRGLALRAQHELDLPELVGLESAGGFEPRPERQELQRRHRLEDVELRDEHFHDRQDPLERVLRAVRLVAAQQRRDAIELVQQLLEPQLIDLVDDDEEQLVMLGSLGTRLLQREELVETQIARVGDRRVRCGHDSSGTSNPTARINAMALLRVTGPGFIR